MSKITDLSGPLYPGVWSYNVLPGLGVHISEFAVEKLAHVASHGFEAFGFTLASITGTYLETGAHMLAGMPMLSDLDLAAFVRPAVVCHVPAKGPEELIHGAELAACCPPIRPGDALLIDCGWGNHWRAADYVTRGPAFHRDCLPWLLAQPIAILGVDVPCIETARSRPDGSEATGNMLIPIFQKGILLLAPLVNLDTIQATRGELIALPLNVEGVSGAPCRAIFVVQGEES
jgi:kynurenine formamidase